MDLGLRTFSEYIDTKYGGYDTFLRLKTSDKEKIFLKYKWGQSEDCNHSLETTRKAIMYTIKDVTEDPNEERKEYFVQVRTWEDYCYTVKSDIGLIQPKETPDNELLDIIKKAKQIFRRDWE